MICAVTAKTVSHRQKFADQDWVYTSKFGAPANSMVTASVNARILNYVRQQSEQNLVYFEAAIYTDERWEEVEKMTGASCQQKRALAAQTIAIAVGLSGEWSQFNGQNLPSETKIYSADRPHIFYFVIMDCNGHFRD